MDISKKAKIISFATQKGGVGKSTLLMLTAAAIHNRTNKHLLVIDSDPQRSVKDIYERENSESRNSYEVFAFNWNYPRSKISFQKTIALAERKYDVILIDVAGTLKGDEVKYSLYASEIVIIPIVASMLDVNATRPFLLDFLPEIIQMKQEKGLFLEVYGVINKKETQLQEELIDEIRAIKNIQFFYSPLSHRLRYKKQISTYKDIVEQHEEDEFNQYFEEFMTKCLV